MSNIIKLPSVRVSFPHFFEKPMINGEEGKYGGVFMLKKDDKNHMKVKDLIQAEMDSLIEEKNDGKELPDSMYCLRDGDARGARPEYAGYWTINANTKRRPLVIDRDKTPLSDDDGKIYPGCVVNAQIDLWFQKNRYGTRVNANLRGVQWVADDEPLDSSYVDPDEVADGFDELEAVADDGDWSDLE